jgi:hypothetical protein
MIITAFAQLLGQETPLTQRASTTTVVHWKSTMAMGNHAAG